MSKIIDLIKYNKRDKLKFNLFIILKVLSKLKFNYVIILEIFP